jgi:hypothetical protein
VAIYLNAREENRPALCAKLREFLAKEGYDADAEIERFVREIRHTFN